MGMCADFLCVLECFINEIASETSAFLRVGGNILLEFVEKLKL